MRAPEAQSQADIDHLKWTNEVQMMLCRAQIKYWGHTNTMQGTQ